MVVQVPDGAQTDRLLHALADATRRDIVRRAMKGDHSVSSLARHYPMSYAAVQKHVAVLEDVGLVTKERRGRKQLIHTDIERVRAAARVLDRLEAVWRRRIERMDDKTRLTVVTTFPSLEAMQQLVAMGMEEGVGAATSQIDGILGVTARVAARPWIAAG
jgi:DNA-binding transcriptional ArsR family regulator